MASRVWHHPSHGRGRTVNAHLRAQWRLAMAGVDPSAEIAFNDRLGRCYELAARYAIDNPGSTLVHGSIQGMGAPRIGHAWVVDADGEVFEPTGGKHWDEMVFEEFHNAEGYMSYRGVEINRAAVRSGHWGPWHDEPYGLATTGARYVFDVGWSRDKDTLKAGELESGWSRVFVDADSEIEARLIAEQMVAGHAEPTMVEHQEDLYLE